MVLEVVAPPFPPPLGEARCVLRNVGSYVALLMASLGGRAFCFSLSTTSNVRRVFASSACPPASAFARVRVLCVCVGLRRRLTQLLVTRIQHELVPMKADVETALAR